MNQDVLAISGTKRWHDKGYTGKDVTIAVLDDFVMSDIIKLYDSTLESSHGLNVCKSAIVTAPDARIIMLKFKGKGADKQKCIQWIKDNKPDLINVSLAGARIQSKEFVELEGYPLVCATGNDGAEEPLYPAAFDFSLKVGSYDHYLNCIARYSNRGHDVLGLNPYIPNSRGDWWRPFGTSHASPFATGQLACYIQYLKEQGIKPTPQMLYDFAKQHKADNGLFVLPDLLKLEVPVMRDLDLLHPDLKVKAEKLIELAKSKGINIILSQTWRTKAEQDTLYAQGRTTPGSIVTNVKYPFSLHCWGVAFDVAVIINGKASWIAAHFDQVGPLGESLGLEWGGRWQNFPDRPHFQLPNISVSDLIKKYGAPENYKESWSDLKEVENVAGFEGPAKVVYKGKELNAGILEGRTFVELRALAELLDLKIYWDNTTKTVTLS
ncbi:MAG: M15 family metallopeptidase [Peptococcales bacterium]|jgi:peptidoglycan L-alanyl-D-glutamate endopeptidase CwlK